MGKLLACDLDGTLFFPRQYKRCISKKNVKFLRKWYDAGNKIVLITSRSHEFTNRLNDEIQRPFDVINCNATQIYHDGVAIKDVWMQNEKLISILEHIDNEYKPRGMLMTTEKYPCVIHNAKRVSFWFMIAYKLWYWFQFHYREPAVVDDKIYYDELKNGKVYKIMTFFGFGKKKSNLSKEINKILRENFPEVESSWTSVVNELTPRGCNKAEGLAFYCQNTNTNVEDVLVVGDSGNDISMFNRFHENSYCMAHAYPSVKKYAKHVITRVYKLDKLVLKGDKK